MRLVNGGNFLCFFMAQQSCYKVSTYEFSKNVLSRYCVLRHLYITYITPTWDFFFRGRYLHDWSSAGANKGRRWIHLAESSPNAYRSVLTPSWLSSNPPWKTAPGGCGIGNREVRGLSSIA